MKILFDKKIYKSIISVKLFIGKNYNSHSDFLIKNGFIIDKCVFCDRYADTIVNIKDGDDNWYIDDFVYYRNNKVCRNKDCICTKINSQSKEWLKKVKGMNDEDIENHLSTKGKKTAEKQKENGRWNEENNMWSKKYWKIRGYSDEQISEILSLKSKKGKNTLREKGWYDDKSNNPFSKDFWIKHGLSEEESTYKVNSRIHNRPEYWEDKGYSKEDSKILSSNSGKRDLKYFIEKYGEKEGQKKYNDKIKKQSVYYKLETIMEREHCSINDAEKIRTEWIRKSHILNGKCSKSATLYFMKLLNELNLSDDILKKTYFGNGNEFGHYDKKYKKYYLYDFVISSLKICIEYNCINWHPKNPCQDWVQPNTHLSAKDVYNKDMRKKQLMEDLGYTYFIVWDDDENSNRNEIINFIKQRIQDYERNKFKKV